MSGPSDSDLKALLDGTLPPDEEQRLSELIAASPELEARLAALSGASEFDAEFAPGETPSSPGPAKAQTALLSLLAPSDDPNSKGRLGAYEIDEVIATGGMAIVYKARDTALNRTVAIKLLSPVLAGNPDARERFLREAKSGAGLDHPNIVPIYAVEPEHEPPCLVMRYVDGETLQDRLDAADGEPLPLDDLLAVASAIAAALAHAHGASLIHRDIKPSNILLERTSDADAGSAEGASARAARTFLSDFGLARPADQSASLALTQTGHFLGTPQYMSPEQAAGKKDAIDHRSDLFSFGAVLYTIATGRAPFDGGSFTELAHRITETAPPPPRELNPKLPAWLANLITRLLAKRPADRPQSAAEVLAVIDEKTNLGTLSLTRLMGRRSRLRRRLARAALIGLASLLALAGLAVAADLTGRTAFINAALVKWTGNPFYIAGDLAVFTDLGSAAAAAQPGATIVVRRNGEIPLPGPVTLPDDTPLTIRAARGFRPVLEAWFDEDIPAIATRSPLTLENLTLATHTRVNPPPLIEIEGAPLVISHCLFVRNRSTMGLIRFPANNATGLVRCRKSPSLTVENTVFVPLDITAIQFGSGYSGTGETPVISLDKVFSYGAHALYFRGPPDERISVEIANCHLAGARPFSLERPAMAPAVAIAAHHSRFEDVRLFAVSGWSTDQLEQRLSWSGNANHYNLRHGFAGNTPGGPQILTGIATLDDWRAFTGNPEPDSTMSRETDSLGEGFLDVTQACDIDAIRDSIGGLYVKGPVALDPAHLGPK